MTSSVISDVPDASTMDSGTIGAPRGDPMILSTMSTQTRMADKPSNAPMARDRRASTSAETSMHAARAIPPTTPNIVVAYRGRKAASIVHTSSVAAITA
jgi:hypothetical protein